MSQPARTNFRLSMQFLSSRTSILSLLCSPHECQMNSSVTQPAHFHHLLALQRPEKGSIL